MQSKICLILVGLVGLIAMVAIAHDYEDVHFHRRGESLEEEIADKIESALDRLVDEVSEDNYEDRPWVQGREGRAHLKGECFVRPGFGPRECKHCLRHLKQRILDRSSRSSYADWRVRDCRLRYQMNAFEDK